MRHLTYNFLGLLSATESLASRGRRLNDTPLQRQGVTYGPDMLMSIEVEPANQKLLVQFVDDGRLELYRGENKEMKLWISNVGTTDIDELWMVSGAEDHIWVVNGKEGKPDRSKAKCIIAHMIIEQKTVLQKATSLGRAIPWPARSLIRSPLAVVF